MWGEMQPQRCRRSYGTRHASRVAGDVALADALPCERLGRGCLIVGDGTKFLKCRHAAYWAIRYANFARLVMDASATRPIRKRLVSRGKTKPVSAARDIAK